MSAIEAELVKFTKVKSAKFHEREDFLLAILLALESKVSNEDLEKISKEAYDWVEEATVQVNKKKPIPDFPDYEPEEPEESEEQSEETADDPLDLPLTNPKHPLHRPMREPENDETNDATGTDADDTVADEPEQTVEADEPAPKAKPKKAVKEAKKAAKPEPKKPPRKAPDYTKLTGEKDSYGIIKGTKTSEVVKMFEKGATMTQVEEEFGSRYYNLLKRLTVDGHKVEKSEGGVFKVTHKDDKKKKGK